MEYLKRLKSPLLMSGILFGSSLLVFLNIDFYAVFLVIIYFVLGSISSLGDRYFEITVNPNAKSIVKMLVESPAVFFLILSFFYVFTGDFYWLFIVLAGFIAFIIFALGLSELTWKNEQIKTKNGNDRAENL